MPGSVKASEPNIAVAWGDNSYGQCSVPEPNTGFRAVSGGYEHSLGLKQDGSIVAWGDNSYSQCNVPSPNTDFVAVSAGYYHSLGLKQDGSIVAWGDTGGGLCDVPSPNSGFVAIAAGMGHSLGLKSDGSVVAWGDNSYGQCDVPEPNTSFVAIAVGWYHSLGVKSDGSVVAWGDNGHYQCNAPEPNTGFTTVSAGAYHSLGLKSDGSVAAWGDNSYGQCSVPESNTGFVGIAAGAAHSLGLKSDGSIAAWGLNVYNQCDVPLPNMDFVAVAAGYVHSLAMKWGDSIVPEANSAIEFKGMSYCGWSENAFSTEDSNTSLGNLRNTGCQWVAINVWEFQDNATSTVIAPDYNLFSVSPESVKVAVDRCHELGMKVLLKPMLDMKTGGWRAYIVPSDEWFAAYHGFMNYWADFAQTNNCEMLCIGCEFEGTSSWADAWRSVANDVRTHYSGPITYAGNYGGESDISWWDAVDYIGIDAYYSLTGITNPTLAQLVSAWTSRANSIESWRNANWPDKQIIFTEVGYGSYDGSNITPWAWLAPEDPTPVDLNEQADCYEALFSACAARDWWAGVFWWNWETDPNYDGREGRDFSPQNKPAEDVIKAYYITITGDMNNDHKVDFYDVAMFCDYWPDQYLVGWPDFNNDGKVDLADFALLAANWSLP
ncbi:MAG: dockerin type I domain-containing protein [Sedimentisphaerales bacterium]